ncbi:hypothetical protein G647_02546 [Cladophialophora carrionii CBS 160.54]|uniref:Uncharacterized protein n=1 Tax=Cladophialophora carrionii CBS 160.54 TaxID=1279043 RepID=V9DIJ6_9EURO|nr:uncharacterized protein G647_02546 [Cladophialophora carrionii CBS 160.54]ETI25772.1 hypothetical protein G647_02546 [Cladophialophora carrionii CBS 160.54]
MALATPPPSTSLIEPPESSDDEPTIHPHLQRYFASLTDSHVNYMRFFSALLIPKNSQPQFFRDIKQFREQATIIYLLYPGTSEAYREVSRRFVGSRFAHPWCRVQSDFGSGWHRANWVGGNGRPNEKVKKEEERLHRLLVPIWIAMRRRMFPGDETIREWVASEDEKAAAAAAEKERARLKDEEIASQSNPHVLAPSPSLSSGADTMVYPELGFATGPRKASSAAASASSSALAASQPSSPGAEAASKMFLGVAVTGFIMSDKRVKKYVKKKLSKK